MDWIAGLVGAVLDVVYPERCALCGADRRLRSWCARGRVVPGLRPWDEPHLCADCLAAQRSDAVSGQSIDVEGGELRLLAAAATGPELVRLVGAWKYHGLRGLAWPLAMLLEDTLERFPSFSSGNDLLVPVPLHRARRRARGFNQAEILVRLLSGRGRGEEAVDLLERRRSTGQQAKLSGAAGRARNMRGAFGCRVGVERAADRRLILVDDLVTSGATVAAAAAPLREAGWEIGGVLALGAVRAGDRRDAKGTGSGASG